MKKRMNTAGKIVGTLFLLVLFNNCSKFRIGRTSEFLSISEVFSGNTEYATGEDLLHVLANFCNLHDSKGRVVFTPFIISLPVEERAEWYALQREAGATHTVLSPAVSYPGSPIPPRDLYGDPKEFRKYIVEALNTPSADGKGFRPILILDGGDRDPKSRIDRFWPALIDEIRDLLPYVIIVPGWELVKASDWTSNDLSYSLKLLHNLGVPHIWLHLSTGRAAGSSNPVESDDPWQGAESGFWKSNGGEYIEGLLYQAEPLRDGENASCDPAVDACWLNRFEDVVPRIGNGMNGWRIVRLVLFENIAYYYYRNQASDKLVEEMANAGKKMCDKYNVKCGFGNGLPTEYRRFVPPATNWDARIDSAVQQHASVTVPDATWADISVTNTGDTIWSNVGIQCDVAGGNWSFTNAGTEVIAGSFPVRPGQQIVLRAVIAPQSVSPQQQTVNVSYRCRLQHGGVAFGGQTPPLNISLYQKTYVPPVPPPPTPPPPPVLSPGVLMYPEVNYYVGADPGLCPAADPSHPYRSLLYGFDLSRIETARGNVKYDFARLAQDLPPTDACLRYIAKQLGLSRGCLDAEDNFMLDRTRDGYIGYRTWSPSTPHWSWFGYNDAHPDPGSAGPAGNSPNCAGVVQP